MIDEIVSTIADARTGSRGGDCRIGLWIPAVLGEHLPRRQLHAAGSAGTYWRGIPGLRTDITVLAAFIVAAVYLATSEYFACDADGVSAGSQRYPMKP